MSKSNEEETDEPFFELKLDYSSSSVEEFTQNFALEAFRSIMEDFIKVAKLYYAIYVFRNSSDHFIIFKDTVFKRYISEKSEADNALIHRFITSVNDAINEMYSPPRDWINPDFFTESQQKKLYTYIQKHPFKKSKRVHNAENRYILKALIETGSIDNDLIDVMFDGALRQNTIFVYNQNYVSEAVQYYVSNGIFQIGYYHIDDNDVPSDDENDFVLPQLSKSNYSNIRVNNNDIIKLQNKIRPGLTESTIGEIKYHPLNVFAKDRLEEYGIHKDTTKLFGDKMYASPNTFRYKNKTTKSRLKKSKKAYSKRKQTRKNNSNNNMEKK